MPQQNANPNAQPFAKDFFAYEADISGLAAGTSTSTNFTIQADSAFMLQKMGVFADIAAAAQTLDGLVIPLCSIQVTDTGSGRNLFNQEVPIPTIFGHSGELFILPVPKEFAPNATVSLTVSNFSASTAYNLRLSFIGQKLFYR